MLATREIWLTRTLDWSEESFAGHLKQTHPNLASSQAATQLLWRIFHFHAFHPFSHTATDGKIDQDAFQRAILLLVARGADLLGVLEEADMYWQFGYDKNLVHQAKVKRILRSIAVPEAATTLTENESNFVVGETADVVGMVQPFFLPDAPRPDEVFPVARRLVSGNPVQSRHRVARKDLAGLLGVLIRLRLHSSAPVGSFEKADSGDDLESTLLDYLWRQDQEYQEFGQVTSILYQLVSAHSFARRGWQRANVGLHVIAKFVHPVLSDMGGPLPASCHGRGGSASSDRWYSKWNSECHLASCASSYHRCERPSRGRG